MSEHIVTSPDGQKFKVNAPDGATQEQIIAFAQQQMASRATPKASESVKQDAPTRLERVGRGAQDVIDRLAQLTIAAGEKTGYYPKPVQVNGEAPALSLGDIATQQMNDERALYEQGRGQNAGIDWARIGGNVGMQAPIALIPGGQTAISRAIGGAVSGGVSGGLQYDETNSLKGTGKNVGIGAALGAVTAPIIGAATDKIGQGLSWATGRVRGLLAASTPAKILKEVPEIKALPPSARLDLIAEAQAQIAKTGNLNADQIARKANLLAQGLTPTRSMVTRNPKDWTLERNLQKLTQSPDEQISGVGQKLTDVYQSNDKALALKLKTLQNGMPKGSAEEQGMTVMKSLDDLATASQKQVSKLYDQVRNQYGDELASDARSLFTVLEDLKDSPAADPVTQAAVRRLTRWGMIDKDGNLTSKTLTVKEAEGLRQFINQQPNVFGKSQIIKAIDEDVLAGAGADAFGGARKAAAERFSMLDNPAVQKSLGTYGELMQGKTAQNFIQQQVVNAPKQDVETLIKTISVAKDREQAIGALQSGVMQHLESKAINPNSGQFSGAAFNKAVEKMGDKLDLVLGKSKAAQIRNLSKASLDATYAPSYSAVNNSNTAPMLMSLLEKGRAVAGVNLPLGLNDTAVKIAARSGYNKQLSDVLAAQSAGKMPNAPASMQELLRLISQSAPVVAPNLVNQRGKQPNAR